MSRDYAKSFYDESLESGNRFAGQMTADFQAQLAQAHAKLSLDECSFYHTMKFPNDEVIEGIWDLRGGERSYLGYLDLSGQRVLELGPASGYLSFYMEKQGASVVCFDLPPGMAQDIVPQAGSDVKTQEGLSIDYARKVTNSWWYGHSKLSSKVKAAYGDIYRLPDDLGRFDISTFGCVLLHLANPFTALQQAAAITDKALIVTETLTKIPDEHESTCMEFVPVDTADSVVVWWGIRPGTVMKMLSILGFFETSVYYHVQKHYPRHDLSKPPIEQLLFTVVGERYRNLVPKISRSESEIDSELDLKRRWAPDLKKLEQLEAEIRSLKASISWRITKPVRRVGSIARRLGLRR